MYKLKKSVFIQAPRERVWFVTLDAETFKQWTSAFAEGSYYEGTWEEGETVRFLIIGENGKPSGMLSRIAEKRAPEFTSIEHIGVVEDGVDVTTGENVEKWVPAFENYTLHEKDGGTQFVVDMDVLDEYREFFETAWPKALGKLKEIAERK